jgi:hypothetical protein
MILLDSYKGAGFSLPGVSRRLLLFIFDSLFLPVGVL